MSASPHALAEVTYETILALDRSSSGPNFAL
jgi:hypothetical protein